MLRSVKDYQVPDGWKSLKTIDMHTGGEPLRVILDGYPAPQGNSVLDYRRFYKVFHDELRQALMHEPRGHKDMYGVIITPSEVADFGVVFMHNEGYSTMCGHATIAITKLAIEAGWVDAREPETRMLMEVPCGIITAYASIKKGQVESMRFENVPSYVVNLDLEIDIEGMGRVKYDLAYGGAYYAVVDADPLGLDLSVKNYQNIRQTGIDIKQAIIQSGLDIQHPQEEDLGFLYGVIFTHSLNGVKSYSRNVCVFAEGEIDRSPTGSGVSARAAINYQRGIQRVGEALTTESILGTQFDCKIMATLDYFGREAVIPEVSGTAYITGKHEFIIDPDDPLKSGFFLH
jgi:trans-L-3-hydroxyproline dehydratase